jgi:hypothetical protein
MSVKKLTAQRLRQIVMEEAAALITPKKTIKLTESRLRQIIREELNENSPYDDGYGESFYEFKVDKTGLTAVSNLAGDDAYEAVMRDFCMHHDCEAYEVETALQLAMGLASPEMVAVDSDSTPESVLFRAEKILGDLKVAYPDSVVNNQKISDLKI